MIYQTIKNIKDGNSTPHTSWVWYKLVTIVKDSYIYCRQSSNTSGNKLLCGRKIAIALHRM